MDCGDCVGQQRTMDDLLCTHRIIMPKSGEIIPVHGTLLRASSAYFETLFRNSTDRDIRLPTDHFGFLESIPALVHCIHGHGSRVGLSEENFFSVYMSADFILLAAEVRAKALDFFKARCAASVDFALDTWSYTDSLYLPELNNVAFEEIVARFASVSMETGCWLSLSPDQVHRILRHDSLNCHSETLVLKAASLWLTANWSERSQHAEQLLMCTRLGLLSLEEVHQALAENRAVRQLPCLMSLWCAYPAAPEDAGARALCERCADSLASAATPRLPHQAIFVIGGWGRGPSADADAVTGPQAACQIYDPRANTWTLRTQDEAQPPSDIGQIGRRVYAGSLVVDDVIYVVGGFDGQALRTVSCYDLQSPGDGWYVGSCMLQKRYYVCCASVGTEIYAIGGHTGEGDSGRLDSVERMCVSDNVWRQIASLRMVRSDAGAASIGDRVYVAGGFDGHQYHDSTEVYDPGANQWTLLRSMSLHRGGVAMVSLGGALYAFGGNNGGERLREIEKYQPETDAWTMFGQLSKPKSNLSAAAVDDRFILVIGGWSDDGNHGVLASVEKLCIDTGEVVSVADLGFAASATAACTVKGRHLLSRHVATPSRALAGIQ